MLEYSLHSLGGGPGRGVYAGKEHDQVCFWKDRWLLAAKSKGAGILKGSGVGERGGKKVARRIEAKGQSGHGMVTVYDAFEISSVFSCDSGRRTGYDCLGFP